MCFVACALDGTQNRVYDHFFLGYVVKRLSNICHRKLSLGAVQVVCNHLWGEHRAHSPVRFDFCLVPLQRFQRTALLFGTVRDTSYFGPYVQKLSGARIVAVRSDGEGAVVRLGTVYGPDLSDLACEAGNEARNEAGKSLYRRLANVSIALRAVRAVRAVRGTYRASGWGGCRTPEDSLLAPR